MTALSLAVLVLLSLGQWREGAVIGVPATGSKTVVFASTVNDITTPAVAFPPNTWITIDFTNGPQWGTTQPDLPDDTLAVFLSGILIITNASNMGTPVLADLTVAFRPPGSTLDCGAYTMQTTAIPGDGARSNAAKLVPLVNKRTELCWRYTAPANMPYGVSSAINLHLDAYLRAGGASPPPPLTGKWFRVCTEATTCYAGYLVPTP